MKRILVILVTIIAVLGGLLIRTNKPKDRYMVSRVIDGDTMIIDNNQEIRLASVDAPEMGFCGSDRAKKRLEELVFNKKIKLSGNVNDRFGRLLVSIYVEDQLINEIMAGEGRVRYTSQDSDGREKIKEAARIARENRTGVYGECLETINPVDPKCGIKGNNREGRKIFVLPGCKGYGNTDIEKDQGDEWFCTETEAIRLGYQKALNCI